MIVTWSLDPGPGGTLVTVTAENVPAAITVEDRSGLAFPLDNLAHFRA